MLILFWNLMSLRWKRLKASGTGAGWDIILSLTLRVYFVMLCSQFNFQSSIAKCWLFACRTPCVQWRSRQWGRPDWRRSNRSCSIQRNSRWVKGTPLHTHKLSLCVCLCMRCSDWMFLLSLRHILRTTPETCSFWDMTKTSILLLSNPTWGTYPSILVRQTNAQSELNF